jgi:hypothetical protein
MKYEFTVRDVFRLANGMTVLACEGDIHLDLPLGSTALLITDGDVRQKIRIAGERLMLNQTSRYGQRALETQDAVCLTVEEAQSGRWMLIFEDS